MSFQSALGRKLQRLGAPPAPRTAVTSTEGAESARASTPEPRTGPALRPRNPTPEPSTGSGIGVPEPTGHGVLHVTRRHYGSEHRHGQVPVSSALAAHPEHVAALALDPSLASVPLERALLLDTETTGLAGGGGTLPFVIGLGGSSQVAESPW